MPLGRGGRTHSQMPIERIRQTIADVACGAIASHRSAAFLWGLIPEPSVVDLIVARSHRPRRRPTTEIHRPRALDAGEISVRAGICCTNPLRTLADLGAVEPGRVDSALTAAAVSRLVSPLAATAALERLSVRGRLGLGPLRAALADWPRGINEPDSELEVLMGRLLRDAAITGFLFHPMVEGFEVDFAHAARRVIVETDGYEYHSSRSAFESDRLRDATLAAAGWLVIRTTWWQVIEQPGDVAARLRQTLATRPSRRVRH